MSRKMKKIAIVSILLSLFLIGCGKWQFDKTDNEKIKGHLENFKKTKHKLETDEVALAIDKNGYIYVAGTIDGNMTLWRYKNNGDLDNNFGTNGLAKTRNKENKDSKYTINIYEKDIYVVRYNNEGTFTWHFQ